MGEDPDELKIRVKKDLATKHALAAAYMKEAEILDRQAKIGKMPGGHEVKINPRGDPMKRLNFQKATQDLGHAPDQLKRRKET